MIRALFLDVDGTLVSFRTHRIAPSAVAALKEARGRGVGVFIATGRAAGDLEVLRDLPRDGVVALNGACGVLPDGTTVFSRPIPREDFERALRLSDELDFPLALELDAGIFVNRVTADVERVAARWIIRCRRRPICGPSSTARSAARCVSIAMPTASRASWPSFRA